MLVRKRKRAWAYSSAVRVVITRFSRDNRVMKGDFPDVSLPQLEASSGVLSIVMFTLGCSHLSTILRYVYHKVSHATLNLLE